MTTAAQPPLKQSSKDGVIPSPASAIQGRLSIKAVLLIFCLALASRLCFNFATPHFNAYSACDAWQYLSDCGAILGLVAHPHSFLSSWFACLTGSATEAVRQMVAIQLRPLADLSISGPAYPLFLASTYFLSGSHFDSGNWAVPVAAQCIISALTCVLIASIGSYAWNRKTGIAAGLIAAAYPGFVIGTGRLVTETFAAFLVTLAIWLVIRGLAQQKTRALTFFLFGMTAAVMQLARPVLVLAAPAVIPLILFQPGWKKKFQAMAFALLGLALALGPWCAWQVVATGRPALLVDRLGGFNFYVGNDTYAGGWQTVPLQTLDGAQNKGLGELAVKVFKRNPSGATWLLFGKLARLYKLPFNDFHASIGLFEPLAQTLLHQILLLFASAGLITAVFLDEHNPSRRKLWSRLLVVMTVAIHLAYAFFIALPRYALTSMPFVILLSAAGLTALLQQSTSKSAGKLLGAVCGTAALFFALERLNPLPFLISVAGPHSEPVCLVISSILKSMFFLGFVASLYLAGRFRAGNLRATKWLALGFLVLALPPVCLPVGAHGRAYEWQALLPDSKRACETIVLPGTLSKQLSKRQCYLLVDADGWQSFFQSGKIIVNGKQINATVIPGLSMPDSIFWYIAGGGNQLIRSYEHSFAGLATPTGVSLLDLRQWFMVPLPPGCLDSPILKVEIEKSNEQPVKLFGSYPLRKNTLQIPNIYSYSWDKAFCGVENDSGLTDPRIDGAISRATCPEQERDLSSEPGLQCGNFNLRLLAPPATDQTAPQFLKLLSASAPSSDYISLTGNERSSFALKSIPSYSTAKLWFSSEDLWLLRITGKLRCEGGAFRPGVDVIVSSQEGGTTHQYLSPWAPSINAKPGEWVTFDIAFPVNPRSFPGRVCAAEAQCYATNTRFSLIGARHNETPHAEFANLRMELLSLPELPVARGYNVY
jgi:4-amino-4-deoxy-L-arabinose transferase-like glycosyltransferase